MNDSVFLADWLVFGLTLSLGGVYLLVRCKKWSTLSDQTRKNSRRSVSYSNVLEFL